MASLESSRAFWDEKARENPYWYVSSFVDYADSDVDSFWASGASIWAEVKAQTGYVPRRSHVAVEIGCGVGRITRAMARELGAVHAFDISRAMIERAARNAPENARFHWSDGATLRPIDSGSADLVLAYLVFQHLPNQAVYARYLKEMVRVAKPGGMIAFTTSPRNWKALLLPLLRARAYLAQWRDATGPRGLHRSEWVGIRPSARSTRRLCSIPLQRQPLPHDRWLFFGTKAAETDGGARANPMPSQLDKILD